VIAVVDMGPTVKTIGRLEAFLLNSRTAVLELYKSPTERVDVDTNENKVKLVRSGVVVSVFNKGEILPC